MSGNVSFKRRELAKKLPIYELIDHCLEQLVKDKGELYLPRPNATDTSPENVARYEGYLKRAVFYDVTGRTLNGLVGQAYSNEPEIKLPKLLEPLLKDANGKNVTLVQSSKEATEYVLSKGRCGLFVDYPSTDGPATRAEVIAGKIKPSINIYSPANIINWDTKKVGSQHLLSLVVLEETIQVRTDGFTLEEQVQYRVLELDQQNNYVQKLYKKNVTATVPNPQITVTGQVAVGTLPDRGEYFNTGTIGFDLFNVIDSLGEPLKEIPFTFIGCVNNDPGVDPAPLYNLAMLNIAHYRNSADYEESAYQVGQPTYVVTGLTADWLKNQLKNVIQVGSRGGLPLPVGATAEILQPEPNSMPMEGMKHKEEQMVAIGARLVQADNAKQTATQVNIENTSETSILATGCKNVSAAYLFALQMCAKMVGASFTDEDLKFELNTDFAITKMSPEEQAALIADWQAGAVTFTEMRSRLRDTGIATLDDAAAKAELEADQAKKDDQAASAAKKLAEAVPPAPIVGKPITA